MELRQYRKLLTSMPCEVAKNWLLTQPTAEDAWKNCERGDWLWWGLRNCEVGPTKEQSIAFAKRNAEAANNYAANAFANAAYAAANAAFANAAANAAANANAAYAAAYAASAAAFAADAAANEADDATYAAARAKERKLQADWIRENIEFPACWKSQ